MECLDKYTSDVFDGSAINVFNEMLSLDFHLDVFIIKLLHGLYNVLINSGISSLDLVVPVVF